MSCENCANAYDEGYTAGHNAENARLRGDLDTALGLRRMESRRVDAATVLIRQAMYDQHTTFRESYSDVYGRRDMRTCGAPLGTSIDTCENCRPYREWLGSKEAGSE